MYHQYREGYIEVICGCMFAGKTEELIRRINVLSYAKQKILVFKPKIDDRYSEIEIASHSGRKVPCYAIDDPEEILDKVTDDVQVVAIDEVQLFNEKIVLVVIIKTGITEPNNTNTLLMFILKSQSKIFGLFFLKRKK